MSTVILLSVLLQLLGFGVSIPEYYVRTTDSPPSDCPHQPCLTLHQYTQTNNFTTGTTLQFLPGNHTLQESLLNLTSISNVTMRRRESNSHVNIICTNAVALQCENVIGLKIEGLNFLLNFIGYEMTALKFNNCHNILILKTKFQGRVDVLNITRAVILQHSTATIKHSVFEGNVGSAIYIQNDSSLTIYGSSFTRNKGLGNGGAVHVEESTLLLDGGIPNLFTYNSDEVNGGAIQCSYNCSIELRGENIFKSNFVSRYDFGIGGALCVINYASILFSGTTIFSRNNASTGGAVYFWNCYILADGEVEFTGNRAQVSGGGMSALWTSIITVNKGHMRFIDNQADGVSAAFQIFRNRESKESILSVTVVNNKVERSAVVDIANCICKHQCNRQH